MILQSTIQRKLSALIGAEVTFDRLNLSLLGGSVEAIGVRVGDLLTIARVVAKVAVGRALKGDIVVTSLTIEKPVAMLVRSADGTMNLPKGKAKPRAAGAPSESGTSNAAEDAEESRWTFDIEKVLLIDGEIQLSAEGGYRATVEKLLLELKRTGNGYGVTLLADSVGRRDRAIELGRLQGTATISNAPDLAALPRAAAEASLELGDNLRLKVRSPELRGKLLELNLDGKLDLAAFKALLP